ncbi:hypothetical protein C2845_PM14G19360 [Panicum miliaceum]|uniref:Uncharacterized protein n=1 Tax=Panicum miliaceum TaxID=4540 RepID=A0A3L6PNP6_PANMI|nr:hypothetical protein C2845_PM14G19360 [Panicum miliaceum]
MAARSWVPPTATRADGDKAGAGGREGRSRKQQAGRGSSDREAGSSRVAGGAVSDLTRRAWMATRHGWIHDLYISACRKYLLPTRGNREIRKLDEEARLLILNVMKEHNNGTGKDLLHVIVDGAQGWQLQGRDAEDLIIGNCKGVYFAGHGTTAVTLTWCLMLLATHPEWQECRDHDGDSPAVPSGVADGARGPDGRQDRRPGRPPGDDHPGGQIDAAHQDKDAWGPDGHRHI